MRLPLLPLASAACAVALLAGCGSQDASSGEPDATPTTPAGTTEPAAAAPDCPEGLRDANGKKGKPATVPATTLPQLGEVEGAWLCTYVPTHGGPKDKTGKGYTWVLDGKRTDVPADSLAAVGESLDGLAVPKPNQPCTMELGPRDLLLVRTAEGDVGVQVDRFGCHDVRLTSAPGEALAGTTTDLGTVTGVLAPGDALVKLIDGLTAEG